MDDLHVPLIVSNPQIQAATVRVPVVTSQIAPSILYVLGLEPEALQAVRAEGTQVLPGFVSLWVAKSPSRRKIPFGHDEASHTHHARASWESQLFNIGFR